ncbi:DUF3696 domain-containing protein [Herpetosiphon llansteffanensis]
MITNLRFQHFKSWNDTNELRFAPLTGFFGSNSSGKTAILQFLLMMKQTFEAKEKNTVLKLDGPYADLGETYDIIYKHEIPNVLNLKIEWFDSGIEVINYENENHEIDYFDEYTFRCSINIAEESNIRFMSYVYSDIRDKGGEIVIEKIIDGYDMFIDENNFKIKDIDIFSLPSIDDFYIMNSMYKNPDSSLRIMLKNINYIGPVRDYPRRIYNNLKNNNFNIGGSNFVDLLIDVKNLSITQQVSNWLQKLHLIYSFRIEKTSNHRRDFKILIKLREKSPEVLLTDVGFGVAQILPVLVLCASAKPGSTIILEQPEIHLHPAVQSNLADILIETIKRGVQIVLESHSEHLLHRLQRRIAEEVLSNTDTALYFCDMDDAGTSHAVPLDVDKYGNIRNWPKDFFGDEMADLAALSRETIRRKKAEAGR